MRPTSFKPQSITKRGLSGRQSMVRILPPAWWRTHKIVPVVSAAVSSRETAGAAANPRSRATASRAPRTRGSPFAHFMPYELQELAVGDVVVSPSILPAMPKPSREGEREGGRDTPNDEPSTTCGEVCLFTRDYAHTASLRLPKPGHAPDTPTRPRIRPP